MLKSSPACCDRNYSHIIHLPEGISPIAHQLNYITDIILELKVDLAKIKIEVKELNNQLTVVHLSLINEVTYSGESMPTISILFLHKYSFQNPKKTKIHFLCKI